MVTLELQNAVVWDNNSADTIQQVWYDSSSVSISSGKTIRLHPIKRDFKLNSNGGGLNVTHIIGNSSALIIGSDTILWETQKWRMFTSDTIWSIYNTENWLTTKDKDAPYTFHHSFVISSDRIERSTP